MSKSKPQTSQKQTQQTTQTSKLTKTNCYKTKSKPTTLSQVVKQIHQQYAAHHQLETNLPSTTKTNTQSKPNTKQPNKYNNKPLKLKHTKFRLIPTPKPTIQNNNQNSQTTKQSAKYPKSQNTQNTKVNNNPKQNTQSNRKCTK